jgi:glycosyltransferase involved in cell wall biosynthesis
MSAVNYSQDATPGLVTVVIPAYRADDCIGEALAAVDRQTYANWEVIVVEDASRGTTQAIVENFAGQHPQHRVVYFRNENNSGPSHTRNVAFQQARGEFIALLDADDSWFQTHLAATLKALREQQVDLAYSSVVMIEDGSDFLLGLWGPQQDDVDDFPHGLFKRNFITPSATVLRRSVIADVGLWATNLRLCEDLDYWLRCLTEGKKFGYVGGCHVLYRQNRPEAATRNRCALQEAFAGVVERYPNLPGTRKRTCRNLASKAWASAARGHYQSDRRKDPSANPAKTPSLLLKAWKLRPKRVDHLIRAGVLSLLGGKREPSSAALPSPTPTEVRKRAA